MQLYSTKWDDYELIDAGGFRKLERFGKYYLIRPEQQAIWNQRLSEKKWKEYAHVEFVQTAKKTGKWEKFKSMPEKWNVGYKTLNNTSFKAQLELTKFKHIGIFPEQSSNWKYISELVPKLGNQAKVLNLFAYTGASSLAAKVAGADVTHVDSIRQVVSWSNNNMQLSGLENIRWVVEDALKFINRESKRGNIYQGIIMDPPTFGFGPKGEKWQLEQKLNQLLETALKILDKKNHFFIINTYSTGFSSIVLSNIISSYYQPDNLECGDLLTKAKSGVILPHGYIARFHKTEGL